MVNGDWLSRDGGMLARITGYDGDTGGHSWTLQRIAIDGTSEDDPRGVSGTASAFELNGQRVPDETIVTLRWAGLDAGGTSIFYIVGSGALVSFPAVTVCAGPNGESEPSGNRYWVQEASVSYAGRVIFAALAQGRIVEATNHFEADDQHNVGQDEPVSVFGARDAGGTMRYWMIAAREGGTPCTASNSLPSSLSSSSSSASSGSSQPSSLSSGSSQPSSVSSGGSSQPPSSGPSSQPPSSQPSEPPPSSGSEKSSAIVPASWSSTGYTALFIAECPEVRFDDVITATIAQKNTTLAMDPRFIEVCEPGSIVVCGCVADQPICIGAAVQGGRVRLRFARKAKRKLQVVIRLSGVRSVITPTGDRPIPFALCERWMKRQTFKGRMQWIVVDDGQTPTVCTMGQEYVRRVRRADDPPHTLPMNLLEGLKRATADKIIIVEDDDWYAPEYIERISERLDNDDLVGEGWAMYYRPGIPGHKCMNNGRWASLAATGFRRAVLPVATDFCERVRGAYVDLHIWRTWSGSKRVYRPSEGRTIIQFKGMPGRPGGMKRHHSETSTFRPDAGFALLKQWLREEAEAYVPGTN